MLLSEKYIVYHLVHIFAIFFDFLVYNAGVNDTGLCSNANLY